MFSIVFSSVVSHGRRQVMISHLFSTACICIHIHAAPGAIHGQLFYVSTYLACRRPCPHLTCRRLPPYLICCHHFRNSIRNVVLLVFLFAFPLFRLFCSGGRVNRGELVFLHFTQGNGNGKLKKFHPRSKDTQRGAKS